MAINTGQSTPYYGQPQNIGAFANITATTTGAVIKSGEGCLYSVSINTPVATSVITLYDGLSTSGTPIASYTIPASPVPSTVTYNVFFSTGLFIVMATASSDITISYN